MPHLISFHRRAAQLLYAHKAQRLLSHGFRLRWRSHTSVTIVACLLGCFLLLSQGIFVSQAIAATENSPALLFEQHCAGCHVNGGNVVRRGKTLKKKAMVRNGYDTVEAIAQIITQGKGIMSAYGDRLSEEDISAIAQYVHEQSESGW